VLLTVYLESAVQSVGSLAKLLHIARPAVTRIIDRLVSRDEDKHDRRRVLVRRTLAGAKFYEDLTRITHEAIASARAHASAGSASSGSDHTVEGVPNSVGMRPLTFFTRAKFVTHGGAALRRFANPSHNTRQEGYSGARARAIRRARDPSSSAFSLSSIPCRSWPPGKGLIDKRFSIYQQNPEIRRATR
jgi:hypothetical protein